MKSNWKNNLGLKIAAVLFSFLLWWTVVNIDDPIASAKYTVEVILKNTEVVTNTGKSYHIVDNTKNVTVTVQARRKVLAEIEKKDIIATADFREMQGTTVPIRITIEGFEGEYEEASANPRNLQVETEDTQKKTFPITVTPVGSVRDGYIIESMTASPQSIDISGPKSSLGRISRVVAKVDVSELSEDTSLQAELIYYDSADNIIDQSLLSSNCDKNGVTVEVKLNKTKTVPVSFNTSEINPGEGYIFTNIEIEPQYIEIAGTSEALASVDSLALGSEVLKKDGITSNVEVVVDVANYLPDGIVLADENEGKIVVRIIVEEVGTKSILLPVRSIKVNGLSENFELAYGPEQEVELRFSGVEDVLQGLTSAKIIATIDLSSYQSAGTYAVPVQISESPEGCNYSGSAKVQIILTQKENAEEDS